MIYFLYLIVAAGVVLLSNMASRYVDLIDKKTNLSGAFIGGIMLSAVTSLPELFTSLSSTIMLDKPGLCIGNILGSNIFNISVLSILILIFHKKFSKAVISKAHIIIGLLCVLIYGVICLNMVNLLNLEVFTISITSIVIVVVYIIGIRNMASGNGEENEEKDKFINHLTVKQIVFRFILVSIGIVVLSIVITYITDLIASELNLGSGIAGAIFLGVATSLPEVSSTIVLFRIKNYDIAVGNIIGSNLFNFVILSLVDIVYIGNGVYDFSDPKTVNLIIFGGIAGILFTLFLALKQKGIKLLYPIGVVACYVAFLVV